MVSEPSTLKPIQTAQRLVEYAVQKHRDRYESCFWKAVSTAAQQMSFMIMTMNHTTSLSLSPSLSLSLSQVCRWGDVVLWKLAVVHCFGRCNKPESIQPWLSKASRRRRVPSWVNYVGL